MEKLKFINQQMEAIGIPYQFGSWKSEIQYPYFVGEQITEEPVTTGDGLQKSTMILTGFHRGDITELIELKEKIKKHFHPLDGCRGKIEGGFIAVFFDGFFPVPSGEADLERIQINLQINEWKEF